MAARKEREYALHVRSEAFYTRCITHPRVNPGEDLIAALLKAERRLCKFDFPVKLTWQFGDDGDAETLLGEGWEVTEHGSLPERAQILKRCRSEMTVRIYASVTAHAYLDGIGATGPRLAFKKVSGPTWPETMKGWTFLRQRLEALSIDQRDSIATQDRRRILYQIAGMSKQDKFAWEATEVYRAWKLTGPIENGKTYIPVFQEMPFGISAMIMDGYLRVRRIEGRPPH